MDAPLQVIYKYPLNLSSTVIHVPNDSRLLKIAMQGNQLCAWIEHAHPAENLELEERKFHVRLTGEQWKFIAAVIPRETVLDGPFVYHVYEDLR